MKTKYLYRGLMTANFGFVLLAGKEYFFELQKVKDDSMSPALERGDWVLISKMFDYQNLDGKIVMFKNPFTSKTVFRRIIGSEFSWLDEKASSILIRVPNGSVWVEHDNKVQEDELTRGFAPNRSHRHEFSKSLVVGEVVFQIFPFSRFGIFNSLATFNPNSYDGKLYHSPFS